MELMIEKVFLLKEKLQKLNGESRNLNYLEREKYKSEVRRLITEIVLLETELTYN